MRIDPRPTAIARTAAPGGAPVASPTRFALSTEGSGGLAAARSAAPLATLDAILMLQAEDADGRQERRRRSAARGQGLLDALDGLKAALLGSGGVAPATLSRLSEQLASAAGPSGDAGLDEVVAAIELRAKVELAKLGAL